MAIRRRRRDTPSATKIAVVAPEDISRSTSWTLKTLLSARILACYGTVDFYGYDIPPQPDDERITYSDLTAIRPFSHTFLASLIVYVHLIWALLKNRYDYVYIPTVLNVFFPALFLAAWASRSRIIYNMHDSIALTIDYASDELYRRAGNRLFARLAKALSGLADWVTLRTAHHVVTVSPSLVRYAKRLTGKSDEHISLVYNYVEVCEESDAQPSQEFLSLRDTYPCLLMILGHLQPQIRGAEMVFSAMAELDPSTYHLIMLGEVERQRYWDDLVREYDIADRVTFLRPVPKTQLLHYLRMIDVQAVGPHPSFALPNKLFDFYKARRPSLVPDTMVDALETLGPWAVPYSPTEQGFVSGLTTWFERGPTLPPAEGHVILPYEAGIRAAFAQAFEAEGTTRATAP